MEGFESIINQKFMEIVMEKMSFAWFIIIFRFLSGKKRPHIT